MDRMQINFRLDKETAERVDQKRVALLAEIGRIPSRSELFRLALDQYLNAPDKSKGKAK